MGVTIHYQGALRDNEAYQGLLQSAQKYAQDHGWTWQMVEIPFVEEQRVIRSNDPDRDEEVVPYGGPMRGIRLSPEIDCEPIELIFGSDMFCGSWTKTQFAGPQIHIAVIDLLRLIEPLFLYLNVFDEGEYWQTQDETTLANHITRTEELIKEYQAQKPGSRIKVQTETGRIVDIIT